MKKFIIFLAGIILLNIACNQAFAYSYRVYEQKDFRFTTQQDRNKRIKTYQEYLEKTGIFDEDHSTYKNTFKEYRKDENYKANLNHIKHKKPLPKEGYTVKGNYYLTADKILESYSVIYDSDPATEYIYDMFGNLREVGILTGEEYILPHYKAYYTFNGYLQKVSFFAIDGAEYIFLTNGKLQGVVIHDKLYNRAGHPFKVWQQ